MLICFIFIADAAKKKLERLSYIFSAWSDVYKWTVLCSTRAGSSLLGNIRLTRKNLAKDKYSNFFAEALVTKKKLFFNIDTRDMGYKTFYVRWKIRLECLSLWVTSALV